MFQRLYELSFALPQNLATWQKLNEGMPPEYTHGFGICFDEQGNFVSIQTIQKTGKDVIYRAGSGNGTDFTPCCKLAESTGKRILKAVENLKHNFSGAEKDRLWLETTTENYKQNKIVIWEELEKVKTAANLSTKTSRGFVFWAKLQENGHIEPVYNWEETKQFLEQQFGDSLGKKGGKRKSGVCLINGKGNQDVFGGFSDIACYNLDKEGSIAGGFDDKLGHRNFPISKEAAIEITRAFHYSQQHLQGSMAGQTYLILPYAINPEIREELYEHLKQYPERFKLGIVKDLVKKEWSLINEFGNLGDQIAFFLIFYEENNASWRIQAEIQELLPSRLIDLKKARETIESSQDLIYYNKDKEEKKIEISALIFKNFTGGSKEQSTNTLKTWLVALFEGKTIDYAYFLHNLVDKLIATGKKNPEYLHNTTLQAFGLYRYALLTHLILNNSTQEQTMSLPHFNSVYGKYIQEHSDFFTKPELITAFLTGCYVSVVTNVQYNERKSMPFAKKFVGRLLTKENLRKLYQEGHDKLMQYDSLGIVVKTLDPDLTESWIYCGKDWRINNEETTFVFTIGYSLQSRINQLYKEQEISEEL